LIELRPVVEADVDAFYLWQLDPEAFQMAVFTPRRDRAGHLEKWRGIIANREGLARTVLLDGLVAGNIVSWRSEGRRLVGYWIGREFWGRGVATEALKLFAAEIEERPLHAFVAVSNVASARVLEKAGFVLAAEQPPPHPGDIQERLYVLE
jgi:RimJ/RimL family protein N-acetyltransferase